MKEYWVNVYEWGCSRLYPNKDNCINWNKRAYKKKLVLYRIHVKMKEPKPKFSGYPTYEDIERTKPKLVKTPRTNWMDN